MLRFHVERLTLAALILAPLIVGGLSLAGDPAERGRALAELRDARPVAEQVNETRIESESSQRGEHRPARSAELRWPFFSFGRRGAL